MAIQLKTGTIVLLAIILLIIYLLLLLTGKVAIPDILVWVRGPRPPDTRKADPDTQKAIDADADAKKALADIDAALRRIRGYLDKIADILKKMNEELDKIKNLEEQLNDALKEGDIEKANKLLGEISDSVDKLSSYHSEVKTIEGLIKGEIDIIKGLEARINADRAVINDLRAQYSPSGKTPDINKFKEFDSRLKTFDIDNISRLETHRTTLSNYEGELTVKIRESTGVYRQGLNIETKCRAKINNRSLNTRGFIEPDPNDNPDRKPRDPLEEQHDFRNNELRKPIELEDDLKTKNKFFDQEQAKNTRDRDRLKQSMLDDDIRRRRINEDTVLIESYKESSQTSLEETARRQDISEKQLNDKLNNSDFRAIADRGFNESLYRADRKSQQDFFKNYETSILERDNKTRALDDSDEKRMRQDMEEKLKNSDLTDAEKQRIIDDRINDYKKTTLEKKKINDIGRARANADFMGGVDFVYNDTYNIIKSNGPKLSMVNSTNLPTDFKEIKKQLEFATSGDISGNTPPAGSQSPDGTVLYETTIDVSNTVDTSKRPYNIATQNSAAMSTSTLEDPNSVTDFSQQNRKATLLDQSIKRDAMTTPKTPKNQKFSDVKFNLSGSRVAIKVGNVFKSTPDFKKIKTAARAKAVKWCLVADENGKFLKTKSKVKNIIKRANQFADGMDMFGMIVMVVQSITMGVIDSIEQYKINSKDPTIGPAEAKRMQGMSIAMNVINTLGIFAPMIAISLIVEQIVTKITIQFVRLVSTMVSLKVATMLAVFLLYVIPLLGQVFMAFDTICSIVEGGIEAARKRDKEGTFVSTNTAVLEPPIAESEVDTLLEYLDRPHYISDFQIEHMEYYIGIFGDNQSDTGYTGGYKCVYNEGSTGSTLEGNTAINCEPGYIYYRWDSFSYTQLLDIVNHNNSNGKYTYTLDARKNIMNYIFDNTFKTQKDYELMTLDEIKEYEYDTTMGCTKFHFDGTFWGIIVIPAKGANQYLWEYSGCSNCEPPAGKTLILTYDLLNIEGYTMLNIPLNKFYDGLLDICNKQNLCFYTLVNDISDPNKILNTSNVMNIATSLASNGSTYDPKLIPYYDIPGVLELFINFLNYSPSSSETEIDVSNTVSNYLCNKSLSDKCFYFFIIKTRYGPLIETYKYDLNKPAGFTGYRDTSSQISAIKAMSTFYNNINNNPYFLDHYIMTPDKLLSFAYLYYGLGGYSIMDTYNIDNKSVSNLLPLKRCITTFIDKINEEFTTKNPTSLITKGNNDDIWHWDKDYNYSDYTEYQSTNGKKLWDSLGTPKYDFPLMSFISQDNNKNKIEVNIRYKDSSISGGKASPDCNSSQDGGYNSIFGLECGPADTQVRGDLENKQGDVLYYTRKMSILEYYNKQLYTVLYTIFSNYQHDRYDYANTDNKVGTFNDIEYVENAFLIKHDFSDDKQTIKNRKLLVLAQEGFFFYLKMLLDIKLDLLFLTYLAKFFIDIESVYTYDKLNYSVPTLYSWAVLGQANLEAKDRTTDDDIIPIDKPGEKPVEPIQFYSPTDPGPLPSISLFESILSFYPLPFKKAKLVGELLDLSEDEKKKIEFGSGYKWMDRIVLVALKYEECIGFSVYKTDKEYKVELYKTTKDLKLADQILIRDSVKKYLYSFLKIDKGDTTLLKDITGIPRTIRIFNGEMFTSLFTTYYDRGVVKGTRRVGPFMSVRLTYVIDGLFPDYTAPCVTMQIKGGAITMGKTHTRKITLQTTYPEGTDYAFIFVSTQYGGGVIAKNNIVRCDYFQVHDKFRAHAVGIITQKIVTFTLAIIAAALAMIAASYFLGPAVAAATTNLAWIWAKMMLLGAELLGLAAVAMIAMLGLT